MYFCDFYFFKGGDLFDAITQSVKFRETEAAGMVKDLCNALFYLHSMKIVHRDLKPENLLVSIKIAIRINDNEKTLKNIGVSLPTTLICNHIGMLVYREDI